MAAKSEDKYSDKETKRRATEALRRALTTPYKPQKEMVGKTGKSKPKKTRQGKP
jgi:hypothetical protein